MFKADRTYKNKRLKNHLIHVVDVKVEDLCMTHCFMESNCVSFNLKASQIGNHYCELNNATHEGHKEEMEESQNFVYRAAKVRILLDLESSHIQPNFLKLVFVS